MKLIKGDLIEAALIGDFDVIGHGCNCFCNMGSGIAKTIRAEWPAVYDADCNTKNGSMDKLGTYSAYQTKDLFILNCYTQYKYGRNKVHADYQAIRLCMARINKDFRGESLGLPKIGCGLAGGDWDIVERIIEEELVDVDVTVMWI